MLFVELLQIRGLCGGHLLGTVCCTALCGRYAAAVLSKVLADVPTVEVADSRPHVFKVGERTCGQALHDGGGDARKSANWKRIKIIIIIFGFIGMANFGN